MGEEKGGHGQNKMKKMIKDYVEGWMGKIQAENEHRWKKIEEERVESKGASTDKAGLLS